MAALFARHTMVVYRIEFKKPRTDEKYRIDDIDGNDILDLFEGYCASPDPLIQISDTERFLRIGSHERNGNLAVVNLQSGRAGIGGSIVSTRTTKEVYGYSADEAGMVNSRFALYRREGYGYALACIERVPNDAGKTPLLVSFKSYLKDSNVKGIMDYEQMTQEEVIQAFKGITDIEVRRYSRSTDVSDGLLTESRYISHIAKHKPRSFFPFAMIQELTNRSNLSAWLGIPEEFDGHEEVRYTLKGYDGSSRTYVLGDNITVPLVELLNDAGQKPLSDSEFSERCLAVCDNLSDYLSRMMK